MKDHQIAQLVNELRQIAYDFHDHQSLRERISRAVIGAVRDTKTASQMLSDEQIMACFPEGMGAVRLPSGWKAFARNVERAILAQQPAKSAEPAGEREALIAILKNQQNNFAASRQQCDEFEGWNWDSVQQVIDYLSGAAQPRQGVEIDECGDRAASRNARRLRGLRRDIDRLRHANALGQPWAAGVRGIHQHAGRTRRHPPRHQRHGSEPWQLISMR